MTSLTCDPHYPRFHLAPESRFLNDPCGAVWKDREFHLFYQWKEIYGEKSVWAHSASSDMVH